MEPKQRNYSENLLRLGFRKFSPIGKYFWDDSNENKKSPAEWKTDLIEKRRELVVEWSHRWKSMNYRFVPLKLIESTRRD